MGIDEIRAALDDTLKKAQQRELLKALAKSVYYDKPWEKDGDGEYGAFDFVKQIKE